MKIPAVLLGVALAASAAADTRAQSTGPDAPALRLRGYVKTMPFLMLAGGFSDATFGNLLHIRLNALWDISSGLDFAVEGRTRLFANPMFKDIPGIKAVFERDDGLVDMSRVWLSDGAWLGHTMVDRLYLGWNPRGWRVRAGRQRINWGINLVSNPNDLFNVYSFFDFDYPERPGADALRVQRYLGYASSVEVAVGPGRRAGRTVAAAKFGFNHRGYDFQAVAGYYRERLAIGGGWAGSLGEAGFKGEFTWFRDLEETPGVKRGNLVAAAGLDYVFSRGTFAVMEVLYNGGHRRTPGEVFLITEPLRPDNIMFSEFAVTLSADHPFSPIVTGGMAVMALPDVRAWFVRPRLGISAAADLDLEIIAQVFTGGKDTLFEEARSALYLSLRYSF